MKSNKGLTIIESLVCLVIIGIGFIAVNQLITFSIASMDRSLERTKVNFLSEMVIEDMIGDSNNSSNYTFSEKCKHTSQSSSDLSGAQKNNFMAHIRNKITLIYLHKVTKLMDFISNSQGYIPLKAVPYIFFLAVVLSITTSTNTFV